MLYGPLLQIDLSYHFWSFILLLGEGEWTHTKWADVSITRTLANKHSTSVKVRACVCFSLSA